MSVRLLIIPIIILLVASARPVQSEIYQWRDENGKLHMSDQPPLGLESEPLDLDPLNIADEVKVKKRRKTAKPEVPQQNNSAQNQLEEACERAKNEYIDLKWGKSHSAKHKVLLDEDNKVISRREQNEIAEAYRHRANHNGCNIQEKKW